jgi:hypothetical protein
MMTIAIKFLASLNEHKEAMRVVDEKTRFWMGGRVSNPLPGLDRRYGLLTFFSALKPC